MHVECRPAVGKAQASVEKRALESCLAHHRERLASCLLNHHYGESGAEGHERCIKWLTLALAEQQAGLVVTRELHVGYYINERLCEYGLLGVQCRSAAEYHSGVLEWAEGRMAA